MLHRLRPTDTIADAHAIEYGAPYIQDEYGRRFFFEPYDSDPQHGVSVSEDAGEGRNVWTETIHPTGATKLRDAVQEAYAQHCQRNRPFAPVEEPRPTDGVRCATCGEPADFSTPCPTCA